MKLKSIFAFTLLSSFLSFPTLAAPGMIERVSVSSSGQQANRSSGAASISFDGRFVAFSSSASNLVPGDSNNVSDIFVRDRETRQTTRISVASDGTQANNASSSPAISDDGRFVAFSSSASNLVPGDSNNTCDRTQEWVYTTGMDTNGYPNGYISRYYASAPDGFSIFYSTYAPGNGITYYPIRIAASHNHVYVGYGVYDDSDYYIRYLAQLNSNFQRQWIVDLFNQNDPLGYIYDVAAYGDYAYSANFWGTGLSEDNFIIYDISDGAKQKRTIKYHDINTTIPNLIAASDSGIFMYLLEPFLGASVVGRTGLYPDSHSFETDELYHDSLRVWYDISALDNFAYGTTPHDPGSIFKIEVPEGINPGGIVWERFSEYSNDGPYPWHISASEEYLYVAYGTLNPPYGQQYIAQLDPTFADELGNLRRNWVMNAFYPVLDIAAVSDTSLYPDTDPNCSDIFVHDLQTGETTRVSVSSSDAEGNLFSYDPAISADGRYVVFESFASNLVPDDTNICDSYTGEGHCRDIFVYDRMTQQIARASVDSMGNESDKLSLEAVISPDGRYVAFWSAATNLVANDTNNFRDVFLHDRDTGATTRTSTSTAGAQGSFHSYTPDLSADGRYVTFLSYATNLIPNTTTSFGNIFVRDTLSGEVTLVSDAYDCTQSNAAPAFRPTISNDGRFIAYSSAASNLVMGDTNNTDDIFVYDTETGETGRLSTTASGQQANSYSYDPAISGSGHIVAFVSASSNLVANDTNSSTDIFVATLPIPAPPVLNYFVPPDVTLTWNSISWSAGYWVQVADNSNFTGTLTYDNPSLAENTLSADLSMEAGSYYWRVRAKNSVGDWGSWSPLETFVVEPEC